MSGLGAKITIEIREDHIAEIKRLNENIEKLLEKLEQKEIKNISDNAGNCGNIKINQGV